MNDRKSGSSVEFSLTYNFRTYIFILMSGRHMVLHNIINAL